MSDFDHTSLHEELELRVIALLTGELSESEADELEKILAIDPKLSAYRDRMAELMGELHEASDELAPPEGEAPRQLSEARRAAIFGDARVLEPSRRRKRVWLNPAYWGIAASIAMVFMIGILGTIKFQSSVLREEAVFEAPPISPPAQKEPEYTVNMEQRNRSTPAPRRPAIVVNNPSELDVPSLGIDVNVDESAVQGRSGGGFGGLSQVRELKRKDNSEKGETPVTLGGDQDDFAIDQVETEWLFDFDNTIPVDIPKERIEGTPQPIRVPGLEPAPTEAPRMVVTKDARQSGAKEKKQDAVVLSGTREMGLAMTDFGYSGERAEKKKGNVDSFAAAPAATEPAARAKPRRAVPVDGYARSGPVDPFSAPAASRAKPKSETSELAKAGRRDFLNGDYDAAADAFGDVLSADPGNAEARLFASRIDSLKDREGQVKSREEMIREVHQAWERPKVFSVSGIAADVVNDGLQNKTENIVIPQIKFTELPLSRAIETLSELSAVYDQEGTGVNIVPIYDEADSDPLVTLSLEKVTLGDAVAELSRAAGYEYRVSRDAIVIDKNEIPAAQRSSTEKLNSIIIPQVNFSGMPLSKVIETLEELSVVYDPQQKGVSMEYKPLNGEDPRVNISLRNLNLNRILQFVTQQVNFSYDTIGGEFIRVQPAIPKTAIEEMAEARAENTRQTPKPEKLAAEDPFSTFSLNISDVSFKLAQAALENSRVPPSGQIRTEEFVNSFDYGDPAPRPDQPVALHWEMAQHPFEHDRQVVRFSLQTQASGRASGQPLNLSLLVDNSGSMQRPDRQAILQNSLQTLEGKLTEQDQLNIVLFSRQPRLIAEAQTRASQKAAVQSALAYRPEGGTNLEAGLKAAYESARRNYLATGSNRVILLTDGAANLGNVNAGELADYVIEQRKQGIALDAYGIGWDDYNDALLEEITRNGDGRYAFLNSVEEASADFAEKLAGTLRVAAANVKVQIEWNPERVQRYRQIGYDLHQLKKEDFRDNTVDAAEIGEAESGTALYVLKIDDDPEITGGLGTLHVRYLDPADGRYKELSWPLPMPRRVAAADAVSPSLRLAMSSAFFGERLAASPYASGYDFNDLYQMTNGLPEAFPNQPRVKQMQSMLLRASELYGENE